MILPNRSSRWLGLLSFGCFLCAQAGAQTAPDADLYYRRTHDGALPPPGVNTSDHSSETTDVIPATAKNVAPPVMSPQLLDNGVDPANLGKGDWLWQMPSCETALGVSTVQGVIDYEKSTKRRAPDSGSMNASDSPERVDDEAVGAPIQLR